MLILKMESGIMLTPNQSIHRPNITQYNLIKNALLHTVETLQNNKDKYHVFKM